MHRAQLSIAVHVWVPEIIWKCSSTRLANP